MINKKIITTLLFSLLIVSLLVVPAITSAQGLKNINAGIDTTAQSAGVKSDASLIGFLAMLVQILLGFIGLVFVILIIYGGFQWMTAMGTEEKVVKAKKTITNAVIGLVLIMLSYSIAYFITMALESAST